MNPVGSRARRRKPLAAGVFQPEISSFRLALSAEGKAAKTVRNYTEAGHWSWQRHLLVAGVRVRSKLVTIKVSGCHRILVICDLK